MNWAELRKEHYNATVLSVDRIHETLMKIRIQPDSGRLDYQPGQYTILALGDWEDRHDGPNSLPQEDIHGKLIKRAYSISCPLLDAEHRFVCCRDYDFIEFYITLVPRPDHESPKRPPLTPRLFALRADDRLHMSTHIVGHYTPERIQPDHNVIFAATGTGEAPHNAMAAELLKRGHKGKIASLTCVRYRQDAGYLWEQAIVQERFPNYRYQILTTREAENLDPQHPKFVGKQYLQNLIAPENFELEFGWRPDPATTHVFLCGNPDMIGIPKRTSEGHHEFPSTTGMLELLQQQGFTIDPHADNVNVHYEKYW